MIFFHKHIWETKSATDFSSTGIPPAYFPARSTTVYQSCEKCSKRRLIKIPGHNAQTITEEINMYKDADMHIMGSGYYDYHAEVTKDFKAKYESSTKRY